VANKKKIAGTATLAVLAVAAVTYVFVTPYNRTRRSTPGRCHDGSLE